MEQETDEFYERVRQGYLELAKQEPNRIVLIDGSQSADKIAGQIWDIISQRFPALLEASHAINRDPRP